MRSLLIIIFFPLMMFSQQNKVLQITYTVLHDGRIYEEYLSASGDNIVSTTAPYEISGSREESEGTIDVTKAATVPKYSYIKKVSSNEVFIKVHMNPAIIMKDVLPNIEWSISSTETKKIGDFNCNLATATYRGSDIYAYFTNDIPIALGPEKLYGLPGAILECGTTDKLNQWIATEVKYVETSKEIIPEGFSFDNEYISFRDEMMEYSKTLREEEKIRNSKLPKGTVVTSTYERKGVEKIYEWELEESEKQ